MSTPSSDLNPWDIPVDIQIHHIGVRCTHIESATTTANDRQRITRIRDSLASFGSPSPSPQPSQSDEQDITGLAESVAKLDINNDNDNNNTNATSNSNKTEKVKQLQDGLRALYNFDYVTPRFAIEQHKARESATPQTPEQDEEVLGGGDHSNANPPTLSNHPEPAESWDADDTTIATSVSDGQAPPPSGNDINGDPITDDPTQPNVESTTTHPVASSNSNPIFPLSNLNAHERASIESFIHAVRAIKEAKNIIVLSGAGISVSAGIPDFRSENGLYSILRGVDLTMGNANASWMDDFEPHLLFDLEYFVNNPIPFYAFYFGMDTIGTLCEPTPSHRFISLLESQGKLLRCYTQNIDNLEMKAGVMKYIPCHGNDQEFHCAGCNARVPIEMLQGFLKQKKIPYCKDIRKYLYTETKKTNPRIKEKELFIAYKINPKCESVWKPAIVFFGEKLPYQFYHNSKLDIGKADLVIVMGTSLQVAPVSGLPSEISVGKAKPFSCPYGSPQSSLEYIRINTRNVPVFTINKEPLGNDTMFIDPLNDFLDGVVTKEVIQAHTLFEQATKGLSNSNPVTLTSNDTAAGGEQFDTSTQSDIQTTTSTSLDPTQSDEQEQSNPSPSPAPTTTSTPTATATNEAVTTPFRNQGLLPTKDSSIEIWDPFFSKRNDTSNRLFFLPSMNFDYEFLGNADDVCNVLATLLSQSTD